jgi:hypothetical protein
MTKKNNPEHIYQGQFDIGIDRKEPFIKKSSIRMCVKEKFNLLYQIPVRTEIYQLKQNIFGI